MRSLARLHVVSSSTRRDRPASCTARHHRAAHVTSPTPTRVDHIDGLESTHRSVTSTHRRWSCRHDRPTRDAAKAVPARDPIRRRVSLSVGVRGRPREQCGCDRTDPHGMLLACVHFSHSMSSYRRRQIRRRRRQRSTRHCRHSSQLICRRATALHWPLI
jgi:hypothetical protein